MRDGVFADYGTVEERKRVVRAFVESLTVAGTKRSGEIRLKNLPALEALTGAFSVESLAGVRYDGQSIKDVGLRLVPVAFKARSGALAPVRAPRTPWGAPILKVAVGG